MRCPFCQSDDTKVLDTRLLDDGSQVRRRRECIACGERHSTRETVDLNLPRLIKSDESRQSFSEDKLPHVIAHAVARGFPVLKRQRPPIRRDVCVAPIVVDFANFVTHGGRHERRLRGDEQRADRSQREGDRDPDVRGGVI